MSGEIFQSWLEFDEIGERVSVLEQFHKLLKVNDDKCNIVRLTGL
jgi:hypothetical protein